METKNPKDFVFIDESGSDTKSSIEYGRIEGGARLKSSQPAGTWERFSIIGAISIFGIVAITYGKWSTTGQLFISFVKNFLLKNLKKGQIVFIDNANFHKDGLIQKLIESVGAKLIYLPPYSPDLSPIEKMWSKIKHYIKKYSPKSGAEFHNALVNSLSELEDDDFVEWYDACGYNV